MSCNSQEPVIWVAIEGIDASGKQTQTAVLANRLNALSCAFPRYTGLLGETILSHLKSVPQEHQRRAWAETLQSLMVSDRFAAMTMINNILHGTDPQAEYGPRNLVCDRYYLSAYAYGASDGLPYAFTDQLHAQLVKPDMHILVDIPVDVSFTRRPVREDAYEANRGRLEAVRTHYQEIFNDPSLVERCGPHKSWRGHDVVYAIVDGTKSEAEVADLIWNLVYGFREGIK